MILGKLNKKENPKKNIHRSTRKGEIDKIAWQNWEHGGKGRRMGRRGRGEEKGVNFREWNVEMEEGQR